MDILGIPLWFILLLMTVLLAIVYIQYMSLSHNTFKNMGIDTPSITKVFGHFGLVARLGLFDVQTELYAKFKDKKVYGLYDMRTPILIIKDLDMMRDILVKHSNKFIDRRVIITPDPPMDHSMLFLKGDHWKRVRNTVSPTFTSGRIKRMLPHIQRNARILVENIREKQERNEEVDLKNLLSNFTLDVISSTAFGYEANSQKDLHDALLTSIKQLTKGNPLFLLFAYFLPPLMHLLKKFNIYLYPKKSMDYLTSFVDMAVESRRGAEEAGKVNDFLDLVVNAEKMSNEDHCSEEFETHGSAKVTPIGLSRLDIQGQAVTFIIAGMETVSTVTSFTLFMLAVHPDICRQVQDEIDKNIGKRSPDFDNIQSLQYLDMCINEVLRLYPPGFFIDRVCNEDIEIQDILIPKGMVVTMPLYAIHRDPEIWPEAEKFLPERFSPEVKEQRHPYAFLPFGQGPRNCIGMRLGLIEVKMALVAVLQNFSPIPCAKTIYPVKLKKLQLMPESGLWTKLEARK